MLVRWTPEALHDLSRLCAFLLPEAEGTSKKVARQLSAATRRLAEHPRLGQKIEDLDQLREVRRLIVGSYESRYEITRHEIAILRVWNAREDR